MSTEVKTRNADFMEDQNDKESLRARIREVEDENQELRAQNLIQNRTIIGMRNELVLMRIQLTEMADTSSLLRERVRNLTQQAQENGGNVGQITAPPLPAPPPVPPPLPPARIRISPRQVGAGEALTTPLGVSVSSPPRHRVKREYRQGVYRSIRLPCPRTDTNEPGPSSPAPFMTSERPNYFVGLRIIPQFQTSFVCSPGQSSGYSDSASDSSGSDDNPHLCKKPRSKVFDSESNYKKTGKEFDLTKNVRNLHHQKLRQTIFQNYNLSLPNTNSKFFFPLTWEQKNWENPTLPSTSGNEIRFPEAPDPGARDSGNGLRTGSKISDCVQYTFPTIHEGLHQSSVVTNTGPPLRLRKLKKNIPYVRPEGGKRNAENVVKFVSEKNQKNVQKSHQKADSESVSSTDEKRRPRAQRPRLTASENSDFEQDGFQGDESSNCMTSTENSLEKICINGDSTVKKTE